MITCKYVGYRSDMWRSEQLHSVHVRRMIIDTQYTSGKITSPSTRARVHLTNNRSVSIVTDTHAVSCRNTSDERA